MTRVQLLGNVVRKPAKDAEKTAEPTAGKWTGLERTGSTDTACLQAQINPDAGEKRQEHAEQSATE